MAASERPGRGPRGRAAAAVVVALALAAAVAALYLPAAGYDFVVFDDLAYVRDNLLVRDGLSAGGAARALRVQEHLWIPLTWLSYMAEVSLAGPSPGVHHATNIVLHALAMAALLLVLRGLTGALRPAALAAALVALHPNRVESVAWITERKDVLCMLLLALALACWLRRVRTGALRWYLATALCFLLALAAKPMAVSFPLLLLLLDFWPLGRFLAPPGERVRVGGRLLLEKAPLLALSAAVAAATLAGQRHDLWSFSPGERLSLLATAPLVHLGRTLWPGAAGVRFFAGNAGVPGPAAALAGGLALAVLTLLALRARRRWPQMIAGWSWFLVALFPVSGVAATGVQWIADRFTFLPHVGLAFALAWTAAGALCGRPRLRGGAIAAAALLLAALALASRARLPLWKDGVALMSRAVAIDPASPRARGYLGHALLDRGDASAAAGELRRALELDPAAADTRFNLALALERLGRDGEAAGEYRELLAREPGDLMARLNLAELLYRLGRSGEAAAEFDDAARRVPGTAEGAFARGRALAAAGRHEEARASYREALGLPSALPAVPSALPELLRDLARGE